MPGSVPVLGSSRAPALGEDRVAVDVLLFLSGSITGLCSGEEAESWCAELCGHPHVGLALPTLQAAHQSSTSCFPIEMVILIFCLNGVIWIQLSPVLRTAIFTLRKTCPILFSLSDKILFLHCF